MMIRGNAVLTTHKRIVSVLTIILVIFCKIQPSYFKHNSNVTTTTAATEDSTATFDQKPNGYTQKNVERTRTPVYLFNQARKKLYLNNYQFKHKLYNVTVPENSVGKTYATSIPYEDLMGITLHDSHNVGVKYRIIAGDRDKLFKAEERIVGNFAFLLIRTRTSNVVLNREKNEEYILKLRAQLHYTSGKNSTNYETDTAVHVRVLDRNDLSPLFYPIEYSTTISEDTPVHQSVLRVMAEDADLGINGEIYYSFLMTNEYFAIHPSTGIITLIKRLKHEDASQFDFNVLANDRGSAINHQSHQASKAKVSIFVEQVNLYAPEIYVKMLSGITPNISSSAHGIVGIVRVNDKDTGRHGEINKLEIIDGDPDGNFVVKRAESESEFYIEMNRLAKLKQPPYVYNLTLRAEDKGFPVRYSYKSTPIQIFSESSNPPIFTKEIYEVAIPETSPPGMPVIRLKVAESDLMKKALVFLEIVGGNEGGEFRINPDSGMLYTQKSLDAESKSLYTLTVSAIDQANIGVRKQSSAKVKINIQDMNDNDPIFEIMNTTISVDENELAHAFVTKVTARDKDSGENSYISYSIANLNDVPFEIDHFSGVIRTTTLIDYETMQRNYVLSVRASDWGLPYRRQTELQLLIKINDVNDNRPQFERVNCIGKVSRRTVIGTELFTVSAVDFDAGDFITYRLISGNEDGCFNLDSTTGILSVGCDLVDVGAEKRAINVSSTDGTHFSDEMSIEIHLINSNHIAISKNGEEETVKGFGSFECRETGVSRRLAEILALAEKNNANNVVNKNRLADVVLTPSRYGENIHTPEFIEFPLELKLNESTQLGETVALIRAKDRDLGYNGKLVFTISSGDYDSVFRIDPDSGELQIIGYLDREREDEYALNITVLDLGQPQKSSSKMLPVIILDNNDNPPIFQKSVASLQLAENALNGTKLFCLNASDADIGKNAEITYIMQNTENVFHVNNSTGCLYLISSLDREKRDRYELHIIAKDNGQPPLSAESVINVIVKDINDNAPAFGVQEFIFKVREDIPRGTVIASIEAFDFDVGVNSEVHFLLKEDATSENELFKIDKHTGVIRTLGYLDYETRQVHNLIVSAIDSGTPSLTSNMPIVIEVIDVNENRYAPEFDDFVYVGKIEENRPKGSVVMNITARDMDDPGPDSKISYSIRGGDGMGSFSVNDQGIIHILAHLDAETKDFYWLTVCAQDQAIVPLSNCVEVYIEIENVNDNVPLSEKPVYYLSIPESSAPYTEIMTIVGIDRDNDPNSQITYKITSGNPEGFFHLDSISGLLTTTERKLDRENQSEHILEISITDNGLPSLQSTTRVVVNVEDINDHSPEFDQRFYKVQVPSTAGINESIYQVYAFDNDSDENGRVSYFIKSGKGRNKFRMDAETGDIYLLKQLEPNNEYDLTIRAEDNGEPKRSQTARLNLVTVGISKESKHQPIIKNVGRIDVTESDRPGFLVSHIEASDDDGDQLWYYIKGGDDRNEFFLGRDNGNLLLSKWLDWEKQQFYNLSIEVTDGTYVAQTQLFIQVIDINDNRPQFTKDTYYVNISENIEEESIIMQLHASDRDEDKKIFYTLHAAEEPTSLSLFRIDSMTGNVIVTQRLDYEKAKHHVLIAIAKDQGTPAKKNYAKIVITVYDHNDHPPEFTSKIIESKVLESAVVGSKIAQLYAIDRDSGTNAEIRYSIITGNVGNTFDVDPSLGIVYLAKSLNMNQMEEYILQVKATDLGEPPLYSQIPVHITVTMSENDPPSFAAPLKVLEIYENLEIGTFITQITARSSSAVFYEITKGNEGGHFHINPSTGIITVNYNIDYEKNKLFNLTITGTSMASATATLNLVVHVIDVNDNTPMFEQNEYFGEVAEGVPIGTYVNVKDFGRNSTPLVMKAYDLDVGINSMIEYSILSDFAKDFFKVDSVTGAIKVIKPLDYETISNFTFDVRANDLGTPKLFSKYSAIVHITVKNINDCSPVFERKELNVSMYVPTYNNVMVTKVYATDADKDDTTQIQYSILDGNADNCFRIDAQTGIVTIADVERLKDLHVLHIRASDGLFSTILQLNIEAEQSNNSGFAFQKARYDFSTVENSTKIANIGLVNVIGNFLHEIIDFEIISETDMFQIGRTSGAISTVGLTFDRESQDNYMLVVEAKSMMYDHNNENEMRIRRAHALVNVSILDVNDNCPIFVNLPYYATLSTDDGKGSIIAKVKAIDLDTQENGEVRYEMKRGNGELFKIDRKTGELTLRQNIEGHNRNYELIISAFDGAIMPCSTDTTVHVKVVDKAMPIFDQQFYTVSVREDIEMYSTLGLKLKAESPVKRGIYYTIAKNNDDDSFEIDYKTAALYVVNELDYEKNNIVDIEVRATDSLTGIYAEITVSINLEDANDCYPEIENDNYNVTILENSLPGTQVLKINATDQDAGANSVLSFHLEAIGENDYSDLFYIDVNEGYLYLKSVLDYEQYKELHLIVVVKDHGTPYLSSKANIWISVTDINDNVPKFKEPSYTSMLSMHAKRGQFVTLTRAHDLDYSDNEKLKYKIIDGNALQSYAINENTGIITLQNVLNFTSNYQTILNVSVTDGVHTSYARVKITLLAENDHSPQFQKSHYEASVKENNDAGVEIATVKATDSDSGKYAMLTYSLLSEKMNALFSINSTSGMITTNVKLDREIQSQYDLIVKATDGGGRFGFATVKVKILDDNDNAPYFTTREYKSVVSLPIVDADSSNSADDSTIGEPNSGMKILQLHAIDLDDPNTSNSEIRYEIKRDTLNEGYRDELLTLDELSGELVLNKYPMRLLNQVLQFFVRCYDNGTPQLHSDIPVSLQFVDGRTTEIPKFDKQLMKLNVLESTPPGTLLTKLRISPTNYTLKFRIASDEKKFAVNDNGDFLLVETLDRETVDTHYITVMVETQTTPMLYELTNIIVHVQDENDNAPLFENTLYSAEIAENVSKVTSILKITATDKDNGSNGDIRYYLENGLEDISNVFDIDLYSGWITSLTTLDREQQSEYNFQVLATDNAVGQQKHISKVPVVIKILDYNDNPPLFKQKSYEVSVLENVLPGTVLLNFLLTDNDSEKSEVDYFIISGDPHSQFQIGATGELFVSQTLDRELIPSYKLNVSVTDGKFNSYSTVDLHIVDVNDNFPYCVRPRYNVTLDENTAQGTVLLRVIAKDADYDDNSSSSTRSEKLRFYLTGNNSDDFVIEKDTGILKVAKLIDREQRSRYTLLAHAQDGQELMRECVSEILINVRDLNDNQPEFSMRQYIVSMPEDTKMKAIVTKVHAIDKDSGRNRKIAYSFIDSNEYFIISPTTGIIKLAKNLDRETISLHNLTIKAEDFGEPKLLSIASLVVNVLDINDNPPEFQMKQYFASVSENASVNTEVIRVYATSKDIGVNAEVTYEIIGGNEQKKFYINPTTGIIYTNKTLDYEKAKYYFLSIQAIDLGIPPLSNVATLNISITDVNDNEPKFMQTMYRIRIREDVDIGAPVVKVMASDDDSAENSMITYELTKGDVLKQFHIHGRTGEITIADTLDRETISNYTIEVRACDNGMPSLCNYVDVQVDVLDANDNPPLFKDTNYTVVVQENRELGHIVLRFDISDADEPPNTTPFTFDFRSGNEGGFFRLEGDGTLRTATRFNHKVTSQYRLQIRVFDNGTPPLYADTWVTIKIIQESQFPPVVKPLEVTVNSLEDDYSGGFIGKVYATDQDQYDVLEFGLSSTFGETFATNKLFNISSKDGRLNAVSNLDVGQYRVNVTVTDGKFIASEIAKVNVELITEEMVNNAVIIRFANISPTGFIASHRKGFIRAIRSTMRCRLKDVIIITLQTPGGTGTATTSTTRPNRSFLTPSLPTSYTAANIVKRDAVPPRNMGNLDVVFVVKKQQIIPNSEAYFATEEIRARLLNNMNEIEDNTNLVIEEIVGSACQGNICMHGKCVNRVLLQRNNIATFGTDTTSVVMPTYRHYNECICNPGYDGRFCDEPVNACSSDPCSPQKICWPAETERGYQCICPRGYSGTFCENKTSKCQNAQCLNVSTSVSFTGKSYAHYKINRSLAKNKLENQFSYSLKLRTVQQTGTLLYASGKIDYNVLEILNGAVQYRFDLGSGEGIVDVTSVYVADGEWHTVTLERILNSAKLTVDSKHISQGSAPGVNGILNIPSSDIYVGAEVRPHPSILGFEDIQRGFIGCMGDISVSFEPLPLYISGGSSIAALKRFTNIEFMCDPSSVLIHLGVCGAQPCHNGGVCTDLGGNDFKCICHARFTGSVCEIDLDPCASNPCLFGGHCEYRGPSNYSCLCPLHLSGKRCEYGKYCTPNPCKNGGICEEGDGMSHCLCRGYTGSTCEIDVNECENQPCGNGATCINEAGSFRCICPSYLTGASCGDPLYSNSISTRFKNLPMEYITGIVSGVTIIVLVIVVVICCILMKSANSPNAANKNKKKKSSLKTRDNFNGEENLNSLISKKERYTSNNPKLSNLDMNHRPVSFTSNANNENIFPSNAIYSNNLDLLRSYGAVGKSEDLDNVPIEFQKINRTNNRLVNINSNNGISDGDKNAWCDHLQMKTFSENKLNNVPETNTTMPVMNRLATLKSNNGRMLPVEMPNVGDYSAMLHHGHGQYHWDCSDWARKSQNPLPDITEVPGAEIADSSSVHSDESNESKLRNIYIFPNVMREVNPKRDMATLNEDITSEYHDSELELSDQPINFELVNSSSCLPSRLSPLNTSEIEDCKLTTGKLYLCHPDSYLPLFKNHHDTDEESSVRNHQYGTVFGEKDTGPRRTRNDLAEETYIFGNVNKKYGSNSDNSVHLCEIEESSDLDEFLPNDT